jgi:dimethylaniline monooxygenase (N-oxide forming)
VCSTPHMRVVVIGAGPAGLVTCKTLLHAATIEHPFDPFILEQEDAVGGTFRYRSYEVLFIFYARTGWQ